MCKPAIKHDYFQDHSGSAKGMEACLSEELLRKGDYSVMTTDEDASSESKVNKMSTMISRNGLTKITLL